MSTKPTPLGVGRRDAYVRGTATSIKSADLNAPSYAIQGRFERRLTGYIDKVSGWESQTWGGVEIPRGVTHSRELVVAIPAGTRSSHSAELDAAIAYGASGSTRGGNSVTVIIVEVR